MNVHVNGKTRELPPGSSVATLISELELQGRLAVEVNGEIVPRGRFSEHELHDGDSVEIVHAIGGG